MAEIIGVNETWLSESRYSPGDLALSFKMLKICFERLDERISDSVICLIGYTASEILNFIKDDMVDYEVLIDQVSSKIDKILAPIDDMEKKDNIYFVPSSDLRDEAELWVEVYKALIRYQEVVEQVKLECR